MTKEIIIKTLDKSLKDSGFYGPTMFLGLLEVGTIVGHGKSADETKEISLKYSKYSEKELIELANQVIAVYSTSAFQNRELYIAPGGLFGSDKPFVIYSREPENR